MMNHPLTTIVDVLKALARWCSVWWLVVGSLTQSYAQDQEISKEYQIKAAYIFNILKFVDWADTNNEKKVTLCIYGNNPFGDLLQALEKRTVSGRTIQVYQTQEKITAECDAVFVSSLPKEKMVVVIAGFNKQHVLTIGEQDLFVASGGVVEFVEVDNTVRFKLNMTQAKAMNLQLSSQLTDTALEVK